MPSNAHDDDERIERWFPAVSGRGLIVAGSMAIGAFLFVVIVMVMIRRESRLECAEKLRNIVASLLVYEDAHRCFPSASTRDASGTPLFSWRLETVSGFYFNMKAIVPFLVDPNHAWDAGRNGEYSLLDIPEFKCPCESSVRTRSYVLVLGDGFIWSEDGTPARSERVLANPETIMVVESCGTALNWAEPGDLNFDEFLARFHARELSCHSGGFHVGLVDGSVRFLSYEMAPSTLEAMFIVDGGR